MVLTVLTAWVSVLPLAPPVRAAADSFEPDGTIGAARWITVGEPAQQHTIDPQDDVDWTRFAVTAGLTYRVHIDGGTLAANTDTYTSLYRDETTDVDANGGGSYTLEWTAADDGTFYTQTMADLGSDDVGAYSIRVVLVGDEYEPDGTSDAASPITPGTTQEHSIDPDGDEDWVAFAVAPGWTYSVRAARTTDDPPVVDLFDSDGSTWLSDPGDEESLVEYTPDSAGTIYARAGGGSIGPYTLTVTRVPIGKLSIPQIVDFGVVAVGSSVQRTVPVANAGTAPLAVSDVRLDGDVAGYSIVSDAASGASIPPGGSRPVVVEYRPVKVYSGAPIAEYRQVTTLVAEYLYAGGVITGVRMTAGFKNLGGSGNLAWRVSGCQPDTSQCAPVFDEAGTGAVVAGGLYRVTIVASAWTGSGRVRLLSPVADVFGLNARPTGLSSVAYHRIAGTRLVIDSNDADSPSSVGLLGVPGAAKVQRPDGQISTKAASGYIGNNIYNTTAAGQTTTRLLRRGAVGTFYIRIQNDGDATSTFTVKGSTASAGSKVRYFSNGIDVTSKMRSASGVKVRLAAGARRAFIVQTTVLRTAVIGSQKPAAVRATWSGAGTSRSDTVKAVVRVVR